MVDVCRKETGTTKRVRGEGGIVGKVHLTLPLWEIDVIFVISKPCMRPFVPKLILVLTFTAFIGGVTSIRVPVFILQRKR